MRLPILVDPLALYLWLVIYFVVGIILGIVIRRIWDSAYKSLKRK